MPSQPTRSDAWNLLTEYTDNPSLLKHAMAVEAAMRAYARHFGEDEDAWGAVGLVHDFDFARAAFGKPSSVKASGNVDALGANSGVSYSCTDLGYDGGTLSCAADCSFDESGCSTCGNGVIEQDEACDTDALAGAFLGTKTSGAAATPEAGDDDADAVARSFLGSPKEGIASVFVGGSTAVASAGSPAKGFSGSKRASSFQIRAASAGRSAAS